MIKSLHIHAWARCPQVGMALVGDAALIDALWPALLAAAGPHTRVSPSTPLARLSQPVATAILAHPAAFSPEQAAAIRADRLLVRAGDYAQLPAAIRDRTPLILEVTQESSPALLRGLLSPTYALREPAQRPPTQPPLETVVDLITQAGLAKERLDLPACRFAAALAEGGAEPAEILEAVVELVIAPRTDVQGPPPPQCQQEQSPSQEDTHDSSPKEQPEPEAPDEHEKPAQEPDPVPSDPPQAARVRRASRSTWPGRGGAEEVSPLRGRTRRVQPWREGSVLAMVPTLAAAAPWQPLRRKEVKRAVVLRREDLRRVDRVTRGAGLAIIVVDASGSMGLGAIRTAKAVALGVLDQGYRNRDRVAIVVVRGKQAYVGLPSTKSVSRARDAVRALPTGGGTPLASGLLLAAQLAARHPPERVRSIVLSDGAANVGVQATGTEAARRDARKALQQLQAASAVHLVPLGRRARGPRRDPFAWLGAGNPNNTV